MYRNLLSKLAQGKELIKEYVDRWVLRSCNYTFMFQSFCVIAAFSIYKSCCSWFILNADNCEDATEHILALVFRAPNFLYLILFGDEDCEWLSME